MALGVGIARSIGGHKAQENSFGLVALCSVGPVLAMLVLPLFSKGSISYELPDSSMLDSFGLPLWEKVLETFGEVAIALALIVFFFMVLQVTVLKISKQSLIQI